MKDKINLDRHLAVIQEDEEYLQEVWYYILPIAVNMIHTLRFFWMSKEDKEWTNKLRNVMMEDKVREQIKKSKKSIAGTWSVRVYPLGMPNAFVLGQSTPTVFVTEGLLKFLKEDEVTAIMLHEVGHIFGLKTTALIGVKAAQPGLVGILSRIISKIVGGSYKKFLPYLNYVAALKILTEAVFGIRIDPVGMVINRYFGQAAELQADDFAIRSGYGKSLAGGFKKLKMFKPDCQTKFCEAVQKVQNAIAVHPPLEKRIERALQDPKIVQQKNPRSLANFVAKKES
jgi:heat shock protein HtpX